MNTIFNIADAADGLIQAIGQFLLENPQVFVGVSITACGSALFAGFML